MLTQEQFEEIRKESYEIGLINEIKDRKDTIRQYMSIASIDVFMDKMSEIIELLDEIEQLSKKLDQI